MRFVHMADIHFDSPFTVLASKNNLANIRRLEQREAFRKAIEYIQTEQIPFLFISGDLYEQEYIRESTIEYINNLFKTIPETKIFIAPGNHDPFLNNSFYNNYKWSKNVTIFNAEIKRIELDEVDIYGYGFSSFYCTNSKVDEIEIKNKNKINILITHGALDSSKTLDMQYNPINSNKLKKIGFDYIALGHIHKANYKNNENNFIYPGSLISFGFDELGEHGMLDIEIEKNNSENNYLNNKNKTKINFIKLDNRIFEEKNIDISEINSSEELIEKIDSIELNQNNFYKIVLIGTKNIEINTNEICKLMGRKDIILKVKDNSNTKYDFDKLSEQNNLKGIFVKKMLERLNDKSENSEEIKKAIEIGLKSFE